MSECLSYVLRTHDFNAPVVIAQNDNFVSRLFFTLFQSFFFSKLTTLGENQLSSSVASLRL